MAVICIASCEPTVGWERMKNKKKINSIEFEHCKSSFEIYKEKWFGCGEMSHSYLNENVGRLANTKHLSGNNDVI